MKRPRDRNSLTLSASEAAELLGISEWKARDAALKGEIPSFTIGTRRLFSRARLTAFVNGARPDITAAGRRAS